MYQEWTAIFHGFSNIDDDFYEELEETLIMGDLGVTCHHEHILDDLKEKVKQQHIKEPLECRQLLIDSIQEQMDVGETAYEFENRTSVVLVIGVNGVGKTTTIGKLAGKLKDSGKKGDPGCCGYVPRCSRGAAERVGKPGGRGYDRRPGRERIRPPLSMMPLRRRRPEMRMCFCVIRQARLHNKKNLMEELRKINRVIDREYPEAYRETLVVLDGTTGQNALAQAREFDGGGRYHRHYPDQAGRDRQGRNCRGHSGGARYPGKVHWRGRVHR